MTYNVFGGTLNLTQSINQSINGGRFVVMMSYWFLPSKHLPLKLTFFSTAFNRNCFIVFLVWRIAKQIHRGVWCSAWMSENIRRTLVCILYCDFLIHILCCSPSLIMHCYVHCSVVCVWSCVRRDWKAGRGQTTSWLYWPVSRGCLMAYNSLTLSRQSTQSRVLPTVNDIFRRTVKSATQRFQRVRLTAGV